jgi:hypothetical protein
MMTIVRLSSVERIDISFPSFPSYTPPPQRTLHSHTLHQILLPPLNLILQILKLLLTFLDRRQIDHLTL